MNINEVNILALAYLGDSVYELRVRDYLINQKIYKVLSHCQSTLILDFRTVAFLLSLVLKEHFNLVFLTM